MFNCEDMVQAIFVGGEGGLADWTVVSRLPWMVSLLRMLSAGSKAFEVRLAGVATNAGLDHSVSYYARVEIVAEGVERDYRSVSVLCIPFGRTVGCVEPWSLPQPVLAVSLQHAPPVRYTYQWKTSFSLIEIPQVALLSAPGYPNWTRLILVV